jgi:hypothetical protein
MVYRIGIHAGAGGGSLCYRIHAIIVAGQAVDELIDAGVVLSSTRGPYSGPTFIFTGLSELKPETIAEATSKEE